MDSYDTSWHFEATYGKSRLEPAGELNQTLGGASGVISYSLDSLCNGTLETGSCGIVLSDYVPPLFLEKQKGGLRVDFEPR